MVFLPFGIGKDRKYDVVIRIIKNGETTKSCKKSSKEKI